MDIPPFSIFSAISELFVTAGVFYVIRRNWTRRPFPFALFLTVALFEALVNVMYMANRSAAAASAPLGHAEALSTGMKVFYASHGLVSLGAFLVFVVLGTLAHQEQRAGRWFFRDHATLTWVFLVVWTISILSGEAIFVLRYLV